jgi:hypothetical protein
MEIFLGAASEQNRFCLPVLERPAWRGLCQGERWLLQHRYRLHIHNTYVMWIVIVCKCFYLFIAYLENQKETLLYGIPSSFRWHYDQTNH